MQENPSPLELLNNVMQAGGLSVSLSIGEGDRLEVQKDGDTYPASRLSDGERNAFILAAWALTADNGSILLIDEPERHLHRAISVSLLAQLFDLRGDCMFFISTHDIDLAASFPQSPTILLRNCDWSGDSVSTWDVDLLGTAEEIPDDMRHAVLGARRGILFVEGGGDDTRSPDHAICQALFPEVTVRPVGSCVDVERMTVGLKKSESLHWVKTWGVIDRDDRTDEEIKRLKGQGIFTLPVYSVEALYVTERALRAVAHRQAETDGTNPDEKYRRALEAGLASVRDEDAARLAARVIERRVRDRVLRKSPSWRTIKEMKSPRCVEISVGIDEDYAKMLGRFRELRKSNDLFRLFQEFPMRETGAEKKVAEALDFRDKFHFRRSVVQCIRADESVREELRMMLAPLAEQIRSELGSLPE